MRGKLITIEGLDGAGKTTLVSGLEAALAERGVAVRPLREPGGVALSEHLRDVVKDPERQIAPRTEALLYAAARAQLVDELLEPLLASGTWVLLDRFVDSSLAYQGAGRGLGIEAIRALNAFATGGLQADRTLLLRLDPAASLERAQQRLLPADRLEAEGEDFCGACAKSYDALAAAEPERIRVLDASRAPGELVDDALQGIREST